MRRPTPLSAALGWFRQANDDGLPAVLLLIRCAIREATCETAPTRKNTEGASLVDGLHQARGGGAVLRTVSLRHVGSLRTLVRRLLVLSPRNRLHEMCQELACTQSQRVEHLPVSHDTSQPSNTESPNSQEKMIIWNEDIMQSSG